MYEPQFVATHVVPGGGLPAWSAPRGGRTGRPSARLDPLLPVRTVDRQGDWSRIMCSNGWSAWVDGRLLIPVPQDPPAASGPLGTADDPGALLARVEQTVERYLRAVRDLAAGSLDAEAFQRHTEGLRVGLVVDGDAAWLFDPEQDRWCYCDGTALTTYAVTEEPAAEPYGEGAPASRPADRAAGPAAWQPTRTDRP